MGEPHQEGSYFWSANIPLLSHSLLLLIYKIQPWPCPPGLLLHSSPHFLPSNHRAFHLFSSSQFPLPSWSLNMLPVLCFPRFFSSLAPPCASGLNLIASFLAEKLSRKPSELQYPLFQPFSIRGPSFLLFWAYHKWRGTNTAW